MKIKICALPLSLLAMLAQPAAAGQVVVGFEDISVDWELISGYGGVSGWENFGRLSTGNSQALGSNLVHAREGSLHFDAAPVVFDGLYINYWVANGIVSPFSLLYQGAVVHSVLIDSDAQPSDSMYWLASGYSGLVDEIRFNYASSDGFIVDNLTYTTLTPVPEPATYVQFAAGLGLLGGLAWRRGAAQRVGKV
ncbi:MAG: PEP-CTERM sorting domain-containing protein [Thiobacillus sp.]|nr:PEP-CTERM sorting domain-containing protein [Thiobacillus sp.]